MRVGPAEVKVFSQNNMGNWSRKQEHEHQGRVYVEAREGEEYLLRVRNATSRKICVLATVDGLSVMDGKEATAKMVDGYVFHPYQQYDIPGWRLDNQEVAQFVFGSVPSSYAEKSGKGGNQGVIGVACWKEKKPKKWVRKPRPITRSRKTRDGEWVTDTMRGTPIGERSAEKGIPISCNVSGQSLGPSGVEVGQEFFASDEVLCSAVPACGPAESAEEPTRGGVDMEFKGDMGTQFGNKTEHRVTTVTFEEEPGSLVKAAFYYASREALKARGIKLEPVVSEAADPFPADDQRGCRPPAGWQS